MHVRYYISQLVRVLWLVNLTGRISLYAPLNSKVCLNWNLPLSIWTERYSEYLTNMVFFGVHTVSYVTSFFCSIYSPRVSRLGHKSERKNFGTDLELVYWEVYTDNWFLNWTLPSNDCCVRNAKYVWEPQRYCRNDSPKLLLFIDVGMTDLPTTHERGKEIGVFFHDLFVYFISLNRCVLYTATNRDLVTSSHFPALQAVCLFTMSSHRLLELPPSLLIGSRDYYGFNLQHLIEMRTEVFWLFFVVLLS